VITGGYVWLWGILRSFTFVYSLYLVNNVFIAVKRDA